MTDTVTKLVSMVDLLCSACVDDVVADDQAIPGYESCADKTRQALQDELTRLFTPLNQCDGCMAGLPLRSGLHIDLDGKALMLCQKRKYGITGAKNEH